MPSKRLESAPDQAELRPIRGYEGLYAITRDGRVRSLPRVILPTIGPPRRIRGRWIRQQLDGKGYAMVGLHCEGKTLLVRVHRVVAEAWLPAPTDGRDQVNHKDRNRANPHADNLEWCTGSENQVHGWQGREASPAARAHTARLNKAKRKLTDEQVLSVRRRVAAGELQRSIARELNVTEGTISHMVHGRKKSQPTEKSHASL